MLHGIGHVIWLPPLFKPKCNMLLLLDHGVQCLCWATKAIQLSPPVLKAHSSCTTHTSAVSLQHLKSLLHLHCTSETPRDSAVPQQHSQSLLHLNYTHKLCCISTVPIATALSQLHSQILTNSASSLRLLQSSSIHSLCYSSGAPTAQKYPQSQLHLHYNSATPTGSATMHLCCIYNLSLCWAIFVYASSTLTSASSCPVRCAFLMLKFPIT